MTRDEFAREVFDKPASTLRERMDRRMHAGGAAATDEDREIL